MFSISAVGWIPVPPVVTLYLALIFTAVWRGQKTHGTEESPPPASKSQGAGPVLDWIGDQTSSTMTGRMLLHAPYDCLPLVGFSRKLLFTVFQKTDASIVVQVEI
jgi:hypothetical protein